MAHEDAVVVQVVGDRLLRSPSAAARREYDMIVVGGGIYGTMVAAEATAQGASVLLLERDDFGGATSFNSLKTIHGGLRYLQSLNLRQHRRFVGERRWFLEQFPDLVERLPVLMPLYHRGVRRPSVMRLALLADHLLSTGRNHNLSGGRSIPRGRILSPSAVKRLFPAVDEKALAGGAVWYDACMPDPQRVIMELLRGACGKGLVALNYVGASELLTAGRQVRGVRAMDEVDGTTFDYRSANVVNAAGPWCRELGRRFDHDHPNLFRYSVAWNVLLDRDALSDHAVAVSPPRVGGRVYFVHPWKDRMLVGTGHASRRTMGDGPAPTPAELRSFLHEIAEAIPGLDLSEDDVLQVYAGFLPVRSEGTTDLTPAPVILDHAASGGPVGLVSVAGNKFTASRVAAREVVAQILGERRGKVPLVLPDPEKIHHRTGGTTFAYDWNPEHLDAPTRDLLSSIIHEEAVVHLDDLMLRRTGIGDNPTRALAMANELVELFDWDTARKKAELTRIREYFLRTGATG